MTGEPIARKKVQITDENLNSNPCPFVLKGSTIESGYGKALVCTVGDFTQLGKLEKLLKIDEEQTPLQEKLDKIATQIGMLGLAIAILTFIALCIRGVIHESKNGIQFFSLDTLNGLLNYFILGVTIVVVAVPEGLPLAVTISLAYSVG